MGQIDALVARSAELKAELLAFARSRRFDRALGQAFDDTVGSRAVGEEELINVLDFFLLQHRLSDGRTVVERFVRSRGDLPRADRDLLLGWRDVVEGMFEVQRVEGAVLVAANLLDELVYRVRTNAGPAIFEQTPPGSFVIARLVPIADDWLISGSLTVFPAEDAERLYRTAAQTACDHPAAVFRNPEKLERAWQLQREDRACFVDFFGSDLVVVPGRELAGRLDGYWRDRTRRIRDGEDTVGRGSSVGRADAPALRFLEAPELAEAATVGMIYDDVEGLSFFAEFGLVQEAFHNPSLVSETRHRAIVRSYLTDDTVSPLPFRRLADSDPGRAGEVFARLLNKPSFSWLRDGEALLRSVKPDYFTNTPFPRITPLSEKLAAYARDVT